MSEITYRAGYRSLRLEDDARPGPRPVAIDVWYPAPSTAGETPHDYGLGAGSVVESGPVADGAFPAIVLSHGAFGSSRNYSWLAEHLARQGYVVCGVSHFGESPVYGAETIDPLAVLDPTPRAIDCSFALDQLLSGSLVPVTVDPARVGALGHSSGGATVIVLAGGVFDLAAMSRYCASEEARDDRGCAYASGQGDTPPRSEAAAKREPHSLRDPRVTAAVALDPALGPGFDAGSLHAVSIPIHLVGALDNDFLPIRAHAHRFARLIPGCSFTPLSDGEGHFIYLNRCRSDLEATGVPLCRDRDGVDRGAVHDRLAPIITAFFDASLGSSPLAGGPDRP